MSSAKLDLRRVPRVYRRAFGWLLEPLKLFHADPLAFIERPASAFARMEKRVGVILEQQLAEGGPEAFTQRMFAPMAAMTASEWVQAPVRLQRDVDKRRRRVARTLLGQQLLALIDAAHAQVRNGPLLACLHPERHGRAGLKVWGRLLIVTERRGEARTEAILDAILVIWEEVYQPYLQSIWKLLQVCDGIAPLSPPRGPKLMQYVTAAATVHYPAIVEPNALRIRDAVAHRHIEHQARGGVVLRNKDGWSARFSTRELEVIMRAMMVASTDTFIEALNAFMMKAMMEPLLPVMPDFARAVVANDRSEIERVGALYHVQERGIWADVARLYGRAPLAAS